MVNEKLESYKIIGKVKTLPYKLRINSEIPKNIQKINLSLTTIVL